MAGPTLLEREIEIQKRIWELPIEVVKTANPVLAGRGVGVADALDQWVEDGTRQLSADNAERRGQYASLHGKTAGYYSLYFNDLMAETAVAVLAPVLSGEIDMLRLGEFLRNPSLGSKARDEMRVVNMVGWGASSMIRTARLNKAAAVPGGVGSCGVTASTQAVFLSGNQLTTPTYVPFDRVSAGLGGRPHVVSSGFGGVSSPRSQIIPALREFAAVDEIFNSSNSMTHIQQLVRQNKGPILFRTEWKGVTNAAKEVEIVDSGHLMTGFMDRGSVRFSDQFGRWRYERLGAGWRLVNEAPTALGQAMKVFEYSSDKVFAFGSVMYRIRNARYMQYLPYAFGAGTMAQTMHRAAANPEQPAVLGKSLALPFYWVHPFLASLLHLISSKAAGRKLKGPWQKQNTPILNGRPPKLRTSTGLSVSRRPGTSEAVGGRLDESISYNYVVALGDTLLGVAGRFYGDPAKYTWITGANPSLRQTAASGRQLQPDDQLPVGTSIAIPAQ